LPRFYITPCLRIPGEREETVKAGYA